MAKALETRGATIEKRRIQYSWLTTLVGWVVRLSPRISVRFTWRMESFSRSMYKMRTTAVFMTIRLLRYRNTILLPVLMQKMTYRNTILVALLM